MVRAAQGKQYGGRHRRTPGRHPVWATFLALLIALAVAVAALWAMRGFPGGGGQAPVGAPPPPPAAEAPVPDIYIEPSRPVEIAIPAIGLRAGFEDTDCRVVDGNIDPATLDLACAYTAPDRPYSLPGTDSPDIVVIAGHTGAGVEAVFNQLYDGHANHHRVHTGDALYLRTQASGGAWLKYVATDLHEPQKELLSGDAAVWGTGATPGRLLTISCIQPPMYAPSIRNAVVGWQFDSVVTDSGLSASS